LEHEEYFIAKEPPIQAVRGVLKKGEVIEFSYDNKIRYIFVIHPHWEGKLHGLDLKYLPRRWLLRVMNAPPEWTERELYDKWAKHDEIKKYEAYRTFNLTKIQMLRQIAYDSSLKPGEIFQPDTQDPSEHE
jgi:hypothetical protein